ncbi:MAG: prepilin-type N-terminal cleavage/methylation domain-containing protein [Chloroflexi bacterium]|nr:prepilin-type N-terminal cleavage/methylation domain-containing protein [Chloroflexota bacterium]
MKGLANKMKGFNGNQRGLTAIELAVVVAILAVLAAIVAGNTTGMSTTARGTSMETDRVEVQKAVDNYRGQNPTSGFPVDGDATVLTQTTAINWDASFTPNETGAVAKLFVPNFLQREAKHSTRTKSSLIVALTNPLGRVWAIGTDGQVQVNLADYEY